MPAINTLVDNIVSRLVQNNPAYSSNPQESAIPLQGGGQVTTPDYQSGNYSQPVSAVDWQPDLQGGAGQDRFAPYPALDVGLPTSTARPSATPQPVAGNRYRDVTDIPADTMKVARTIGNWVGNGFMTDAARARVDYANSPEGVAEYDRNRAAVAQRNQAIYDTWKPGTNPPTATPSQNSVAGSGKPAPAPVQSKPVAVRPSATPQPVAALPEVAQGKIGQPVSVASTTNRTAPAPSTTAISTKQPSGGGSGFIASGGKTYRYTPSTPEQTAAEQARYDNYLAGQQQQSLDLRGQQNADFRTRALKDYQDSTDEISSRMRMSPKMAMEYAMANSSSNPIFRQNSAAEVAQYNSAIDAAKARQQAAANALGIEMKDAESMRGYDANKYHSDQALAGTKYTADAGVKGHQIAGKAQVQAARETALGHVAAANAKGEEGEDKEWSSAYNAYANSAHGKTVTKDEGFGEPTTITTQPDPERAKRDKERLFAITTQRIKKNKWSYNQAMDNLSSLWPEYVEFMNRGSSATPAKQPNFQQGVESALLLGGR